MLVHAPRRPLPLAMLLATLLVFGFAARSAALAGHEATETYAKFENDNVSIGYSWYNACGTISVPLSFQPADWHGYFYVNAGGQQRVQFGGFIFTPLSSTAVSREYHWGGTDQDNTTYKAGDSGTIKVRFVHRVTGQWFETNPLPVVLGVPTGRCLQ